MTRGLRNNNPLNIRNGYSRWVGKANKQTDPHFVCFMTKAMGYRAAWKIMYSYLLRMQAEGMDYTLRNIITRWAPPTENDTRNYIRTVLTLTSLGGKENLPQPSRGVDTERLVRLVQAMTTMECGVPYKEVDVDAIREGWRLAFPGKCSLARTKPVEDREEECVNPDDWLFWDEYRDW